MMELILSKKCILFIQYDYRITLKEEQIGMNREEADYWRNKTAWIEPPRGDDKIHLDRSKLHEEDMHLYAVRFHKEKARIKEIMELNMVLYGKW